MTKQNHAHKLKRVNFKSGNRFYFCVLPDCNYKINPALALGKRAICWRCGNEFFLNEYSLRLAKPHCENCHKIKVMKEDVIIDNTPVMSANDKAAEQSLKTLELPVGANATSLAERMRAINTKHQITPDEEI